MPFLNLPSSVRLHYEVLKPDGTSGDQLAADPTKPTLVALVPFLARTAMDVPQLRPGSSLRADYQIIAMSPRSHGRTTSEVRPQHDPFVSAADLAFAFKALQLPPCPVYAPGFIAGRTAVAFAILFPELVTALALIGVSGTEGMTTVEGFRTLDATLFNPEEPADLYEALGELAMSMYNDSLDVEAFDDVMSFLVRRHNPRHALRSYELCRIAYLNVNLTPEAVAGISQPVLALHGEKDQYTQDGDVEIWTDQLYRSEEVETHIIPDAPHVCWISHPDTTTALISSFLSRHTPSTPATYVAPDFAAALQRTATLFSNPEALLRDPRLPESFSSLTTEQVAGVAADIERLRGYEQAWRSRPLVEGAEGVEAWEEDAAISVPRPRWRWSRRDEAFATSPHNASPRYSVASEVVVEIASTQSAEQVDSSWVDSKPRSVVEVSASPTIPAKADASASSAVDGEDDVEGHVRLNREDSGFSEGVAPQKPEVSPQASPDVVKPTAGLAA